MKGSFLALSFLLFFPRALQSQVEQLWTIGITNTIVLEPSPPPDASLTNYFFTEGTVDQSGNTIVAGIAYVNAPLDAETRTNYPVVLVEKINSRGKRIWEYFNAKEATVLIEALETDPAGNIFFIAGFNSVSRAATLVKLSPNGRKLWQVAQNDEGVTLTLHNANVKIDYAGNAYFFVLRVRATSSGTPDIDLVLSKIDPRGGRLWSQTLPWDGKPFDQNALSKALALFEDGSIAAAAGNTIWKLDPSGRIEWTTHKGYPSILVSPKGTICTTALGEAYAVFSREGKLLASGTGLSGLGMDVQSVSRQSNFLLANYGVIEELSANGRARWQNIIRLAVPGAAPVRDDGWFIVGGPAEMNLIRLDKAGAETSRTPIPGYYGTGNTHITKPLYRSSDGTIRVIYDLRVSNLEIDPFGVGISAFQEQR